MKARNVAQTIIIFDFVWIVDITGPGYRAVIEKVFFCDNIVSGLLMCRIHIQRRKIIRLRKKFSRRAMVIPAVMRHVHQIAAANVSRRGAFPPQMPRPHLVPQLTVRKRSLSPMPSLLLSPPRPSLRVETHHGATQLRCVTMKKFLLYIVIRATAFYHVSI